VPVNLRKDALCAAAEFVLAVEDLARKTTGLVATVGQLSVSPGASNVIPGEAQLTLDLRHSKDAVRRSAFIKLKQTALQIAARRKLKLALETLHETPAAICSNHLSAELALSVAHHQKKVLLLPSGAGHDAAVMAKITPAAMLFIRCKDGISHHPAESVKVDDISIALDVLNDLILRLAKKHE
jgi:allantoate deiminase